MIVCIENPQDPTEKLLELINKFHKVARYKINIQKSVVFLYTNNKLSEREIKETTLFTIASKKYLGIHLTKEMKNLFSENCQTLMKETGKDTKKWKDSLCKWVE